MYHSSTQDGIRCINNNEYGKFDLQEEENLPLLTVEIFPPLRDT